MPLQATSGAASYDAFGGGVPVVPNYIEDVFSTYLYTGTGSAQTITNGIDLSTKGGLVWVKNRSSAVQHFLFDTSRGMGFASQSPFLSSNLTDPQTDAGTNYIRADTTGFSYGSGASGSGVNAPPNTYVSWTFRKQPKFFDVVTYTGTGAATTIAHNLGSVPGMMIIKRLNTDTNWPVYHRSLAATEYMILNGTSEVNADSGVFWNSTRPTSTVFSLGGNANVNGSGDTYVAYLFAHDAGGFGLSGTDNVISCGSFTTDGSGNATVSLGYEPQWLLVKKTNFGGWWLTDTMRGMTVATSNNVKALFADSSSAESNGYLAKPNATGFTVGPSSDLGNSITAIYIAIRRGPMKVPTLGTSVFAPVLANGGNTTITTNFPVDLLINKPPSSTNAPYFMDRLRGGTTNTYNILQSSSTAAELVGSGLGLGFQSNIGIQSSSSFYTVDTIVLWLNFRRAPSFFDEVCYTGTGVATNFTHNLGVAPELLIVKARNGNANWGVYAAPLGATKYLTLEYNDPSGTSSVFWNNTAPTSTVFTLGTASGINGATTQGVAYLFATCAGVSKVGSFTGNGTSQTIPCGFTSGARFVLIKKSSGTGDWMVSDSARGIVAGSDPYLELNNTNAEVTGEDWLDTDSTGFVVNEVSGSNANTSGGTYIFLAIA